MGPYGPHFQTHPPKKSTRKGRKVPIWSLVAAMASQSIVGWDYPLKSVPKDKYTCMCTYTVILLCVFTLRKENCNANNYWLWQCVVMLIIYIYICMATWGWSCMEVHKLRFKKTMLVDKSPFNLPKKKSENTDRFTHVYCYLYLQRTQAKNSPGLPPPNHVTVGVQGISAVMPAATTGTMVQWCAMHKKWDHTVKRHEVKQLNYKYIRLSICI